MRINYYRYYFKYQNKVTFYSIQNLIYQYLHNAPATFQEQFKTTISNDNLYIFETTINNLYFFMRTRDDEVIRKINSSKLTIEDIKATFNPDEKLGFSSYIYVDQDYIGFASTNLAPKASDFTDFMNQLVQKIDSNLIFELEAIMTELSAADAKKLAFVSRAHIKVPASKSMMADILGSVGYNTPNPSINVDYIEVILKAEPGKNILEQTKSILDAATSQTDKFILSAKANMADNLRDYYIEAAGGLSDTIYQGKKASDTERKIETKILTNTDLKQILDRKRKNEKKQTEDISVITNYITNNRWV